MTFHDVRMRGFEKRARLDAVLEWLLAQTKPLASEAIAFSSSGGRILAEDVIAGESVPPFRRSAMDGYALKGEETDGASDYGPLRLKIVGQSFPGAPFEGVLQAGEAVRIMTGAPVPEGADAVLPAEYTDEKDDVVQFSGSVPPGKNVGAIGEDIKAGTTILKQGRRLRPQDIGLLASVGQAVIDVVRRPKVRLLITGNELYPVGKGKPPHTIYDSNSPMLVSLIQRDGGEIENRYQLADEQDAIAKGLQEPGADVILVSGGSSVGAEDHAPSLVAELGELNYHGIAMRPASPAGVGTIGETIVFLLPGNPVSCLCAYDLLAGRAIRKLGGQNPALPYITQTLPLRMKIVSAIGRLDYCRVKIEDRQVVPIATSGASVLSSTSRADGFVLIAEEQEGYAEGSMVTVYRYDLPFGEEAI